MSDQAMDQASIEAARAKMRAKMGGQTTIGGKGTQRRKVKSKHASTKDNEANDKKLSAQFKKLGMNTVPGIEEVNMFSADGNVLQFKEPKMQASFQSNTYVISGTSEKKKASEIADSGASIADLQKLLEKLGPNGAQALAQAQMAAQAQAAGAGSSGDMDIPDLGETNFEAVSKEDVEVD